LKTFQRPLILLIISFFTVVMAHAQRLPFGLKDPGADAAEKCGEFQQLLNSMPVDVTYGFQLEPNNDIYFVMTDKAWFEKCFQNNMDGIGIDVILKSQFPCGAENKLGNSPIHMGTMLPPTMYKDFKEEVFQAPTGEVFIKVGTLPDRFVRQDYELNVLFIQNNYVCYYNNFYDIARSRWDLLEMGLYIDTLNGPGTAGPLEQERAFGQRIQSKRLRFVVPFEKNKSKYRPEDIKPMYDSLRLTDYHIDRVSIHAYSSVEGSAANNARLQEQRAATMLEALQSFQEKTIQTNIKVSENWVEFLRDIAGTPHSYLARMSKKEIKRELEKGLADELEPVLKNHRKAVMVFELRKKSRFTEMDGPSIQSFFQKSVLERNIEEALAVQQEIFMRIRKNQLPDDLSDKLEVPEEVEFGPLLLNKATFSYERNEEDIYGAIMAFRKLLDILPENHQLHYNISVLNIKAWLFGQLSMEPSRLKRSIEGLGSWGIRDQLIRRLLVNYHIIESEYKYQERDYAGKNKALQYIYDNYSILQLGNEDLLRLAKYFSSYNRMDWSELVLRPHAEKIDADEELLFYYLNLTVIDPENVKRPGYRNIMLNAINQNEKRFCGLFDPFGNGGITFQLLNNEYLKQTYCENCSGY